MDYSVFPNVKKIQIEESAKQRKSIVDSKYQDEISKLRSENETKNNRLMANVQEPSPVSNYVFGFGATGVAISFLMCCLGCCSNGLEGIEDAIVYTAIALAIGGFIIGGVVGSVTHSSYKKTKQSSDDTVRNRNQETDSKVASLQRECNEKKAEIDQEANLEIARYQNGFESEAKAESVKYAESELAKKVIDWISDGYIKTIEATDRRSHIEKISVPFVFNVYVDRITCNLGEFDFEVERCRNLENPLDQTALARAIASSIQVNITIKFPKDPSGTDIIVDTSYSYHSDHVSTTMNYTAPNGNYEAVKGW